MKSSLSTRWHAADAARQTVLERARLCASLTKPWILPPQGQTADTRLPETYQSVGPLGVTNLEGRMLIALFPPDRPWFRLQVASHLRYGEDPAKVAIANRALFVRELLVQSMLESGSSVSAGADNRRRGGGFRTAKRSALANVLVTGDTLEQLTDDYRLKVFRRDQYIVQRDSSCDVLCMGVRERIDPYTLTDEQRESANIKADDDRDAYERMEDIYTFCEWHPWSKTWVTRQEVKDVIIAESEDGVAPMWPTAYELSPGEHYGRGFVELNLGDLRSVNELERRLLEFTAIASKLLIAKDISSQVRNEDLLKGPGEVVEGMRVSGGVVQDVAMLSLTHTPDFSVVSNTAVRKTQQLARAMLMETETTPRGERVTAYQVQRVAMELEQSLGGVYSAIADEQQIPLLRRTIYQLRRDGMLTLNDNELGGVEIEALTGIRALSMANNQAALLNFVQTLAAIGPEATARLNQSVLLDVLARYNNIDEPGLIRSEEEMRAEQARQMQQAMVAAAAQKGIDTVGNIAETVATQQGTATP
jgi:hypothetical protein